MAELVLIVDQRFWGITGLTALGRLLGWVLLDVRDGCTPEIVPKLNVDTLALS